MATTVKGHGSGDPAVRPPLPLLDPAAAATPRTNRRATPSPLTSNACNLPHFPEHPRDFTFDETIKRLSKTLGKKSSLVIIRYQCLKLVKNETDDFLTLASIVNRECEVIKLQEITEDQFKCLIFLSALRSAHDAETRTRLRSKIEQDPDSTLRKLMAECKRLKNLKYDSAIVEQPSSSFAAINIRAVTRKKSISPQKP
ncbi:unnamed protein product [Dibothriocephalus latus]|uniref:Uncharacterized protein n=1 Tax=Dibothriocephalus latus TaxID=60516 RepID=A0A3P6TV64_DIBLA|nr:unnamed protein product [Dibothriocephalus latus]